jgi:hypothetical protein
MWLHHGGLHNSDLQSLPAEAACLKTLLHASDDAPPQWRKSWCLHMAPKGWHELASSILQDQVCSATRPLAPGSIAVHHLMRWSRRRGSAHAQELHVEVQCGVWRDHTAKRSAHMHSVHSVTRPHGPANWLAYILSHCQQKKCASRQVQSLTTHTECASSHPPAPAAPYAKLQRHHDTVTA